MVAPGGQTAGGSVRASEHWELFTDPFMVRNETHKSRFIARKKPTVMFV